MKHIKIIIFSTLLIGYLQSNLFSQESIIVDSLDNEYFEDNYLRYKDFLYQSGIKSARIFSINDVLSDPIVELNSNQQLKLIFDDLSEETKDYNYKIIHCNSQWIPSDISLFDVIDGFEYNQIRDYDFSFNTYHNYIHYELLLPNDDISFKVSGNYLVVVYNEDIPVLSKRFYIVETKANIGIDVKRPSIIDLRKSHQEVDFTVSSYFNISDPFNEISVIIRQNGRFDNQIDNLKPLYIRDNELLYDYQNENCFKGLNEFRYFNTKDIRFESQGIAQIKYIDPYYHFYLENSDKRRFKVYKYDKELNGNYFVDVADGDDMEIEADYVYVTFFLNYSAPVVNGNIFVFGALSNWDYTSDNKMLYNFETKQYECTMLLKQGYYNYMFAFYEDGETSADIEYIEGTHYQTDNDYTVFVYYKDRSDRYQKLIAVKTKNSISKL